MKRTIKPAIFIILIFCIFVLKRTTTFALDLPRGDEQFGPRDRVHAICDPAPNPRDVRGDMIDCSGYPSITPSQNQNPTSPPQPTGGVGGVPTSTPSPSDSGSGGDDNPCAPGKPFTGPYCGWSPSPDNSNNEGGGVGGLPQVNGLSYTSSISDLAPSDIMFFFGVLCLLLYIKSKFTKKLTKTG